MKRNPLLLCLLVVTLASCSDSGSGSSADDSSDSTADGGLIDPAAVIDPLTEELATIREANDGFLPLQESLDLFASTRGPIPGGDASRFPTTETGAHLAFRAVMRYWEQLTPEQQDAVRASFPLRPTAQPGPGRHASSQRAPLSPPAEPEPLPSVSEEELAAIVAGFRAEVATARAAIAARLGFDLPIDEINVEYYHGIVMDSGQRLHAETGATDADGVEIYNGSPEGCTVYFYGPTSALTISHEVFHCFQFFIVRDLSRFWELQSWIVEGSAEWVGHTLSWDGSEFSWFGHWLTSQHSLYAMAYEAIGYYFVLESMGVSPWDVIDDMLTAEGGLAAVAASGLDPADVLSRVTSSKARAHTVGGFAVTDRWDFSASNLPRYGYFTRATVTPGSPNRASFALGRFAAAPVEVIRLEGGSIVQVALNGEVGTLEFFGQDPIEWDGSLVREFCLEEEGCSCTAGTEPLEQAPRDLILGAGQLDPGTVTYDIRIPDQAFTDGNWQGTITSPDLTIAGEGGTGFRPGVEAPINFTIEQGIVTTGTYSLQFPAIFESPMGSAIGVVTINGQVTGCAHAPKLDPTSIIIDATIELTDGFTIPVLTEVNYAAGTITVQQADGTRLSRPIDGGATSTSTGFTSWIIDRASTPTHRVGELDASAELATMATAGFAVSQLQFTFDITRA